MFLVQGCGGSPLTMVSGQVPVLWRLWRRATSFFRLYSTPPYLTPLHRQRKINVEVHISLSDRSLLGSTVLIYCCPHQSRPFKVTDHDLTEPVQQQFQWAYPLTQVNSGQSIRNLSDPSTQEKVVCNDCLPYFSRCRHVEGLIFTDRAGARPNSAASSRENQASAFPFFRWSVDTDA